MYSTRCYTRLSGGVKNAFGYVLAAVDAGSGLTQQCRQLNCHTANICRVHRLTYARTYPTHVVLPDGSSIVIRYHEPRKIIKLPLDLSTLSEEERRARLERRKPKKKLKVVEEVEDSFDVNKYIKFIKKA